jgi:hypothetical protein
MSLKDCGSEQESLVGVPAFRVVLSPGQRVVVEFEGTDGQIGVDFDSQGDSKLEVTADIPDSSGRTGVIYCEDFSRPLGREKVAIYDSLADDASTSESDS